MHSVHQSLLLAPFRFTFQYTFRKQLFRTQIAEKGCKWFKQVPGKDEQWDHFCSYSLVPRTIYLSFWEYDPYEGLWFIEYTSLGVWHLILGNHWFWAGISGYSLEGYSNALSLWLFSISSVLDAIWWAWPYDTKIFIICVHFHMFIYMPILWISLSLVFPFFSFQALISLPSQLPLSMNLYMYSHLASLLFLHKVDGQVQISDFVLSLGVLARILNPVCWESILSFFSYRPSTSLAWLCWKFTLAIGQVDRMGDRGIS